MMLQLLLPVDLDRRLRQKAERRGQSTESVALQLLEQHLPPPVDERRAAALLERWQKEDAALSAEQAAGNAEVLRALDADRPSYRKLFPEL